MDNTYYSYLLIPSTGYRSHVYAGWTALLVNAGEGIDLDIYLQRQPKEQIARKLGQQLRINRSKLKDANDTNTDFDDLKGLSKAATSLKKGWRKIRILLPDGFGDGQRRFRAGTRMAGCRTKKLLVSQDLDCSPAFSGRSKPFCPPSAGGTG